ncbi:restriction endonuclease subunit S [Bacillus sp. 41-22]|uniref:restriction endonuclease subunit S n=1 Tax=Bacillus sp. 41-22 TaxID=2876713 RepID=UPI0021F1615D|nr:restriction endonuclease subunit S [Bacillus sp. 41-22]UYO21133.1 restriction endonuclease subunit S [Bacillus sp. 41-22]
MIINAIKRSDSNSSIPSDWEYSTVEELIEKDKRAIKIGPFGSSLKKEYLTKNGYKVYGQENIIEGNFQIGDRFVDEERFELLKSSEIKPGDIVMSMMGTIGKSMIVPQDIQRGIMDSHLLRIRLNENVINKELFIHQFKDYFPTIKQIQQQSVGGIMSGLSSSIVKKIKLAVPPLKEQQKIVSILSTWDKAIELEEKLIEQKKEQRKGLIQKLLWGHVRWNDIERGYSDQELNERDSLIIQGIPPEGYQKVKRFIIPKDWEFLKIGEIAQQVSNVNKDNNKYIVLSCTKYDGLVDSLKYFGKQVFSSDLSKYKVVSKNEFAYATNHIEEGSIGLQRSYDFGLVSPMYTVFKSKSNINNEFLFALLKTENYRRIYETMMSASVDRRGSLRWNAFSKIQVPVPSMKEQEKIMSILLTSIKEIKYLEKKLEDLNLQKKGLMQLLLTGKIRVKM